MSLAERLRKVPAKNNTQQNYRETKLLQETLWGTPEPIEIEVEPTHKPIQDPRPELNEDSKLWVRFLNSVYEHNKELAWNLHGFRAVGTRLVRGRNGNYVLRPILDPKYGWNDQQDYERMKEICLKPHTRLIVDLLKKL